MSQNFIRFFLLVSLPVIMNFAYLMKLWFFSLSVCMLIWFCNKKSLYHFCGYLVLYWKRSLSFLHIVFYITCIILNMTYVPEQLTLWKILCFLSLLNIESQCNCDLVAGQCSAISKTRKTLFQSAFLFSLQCSFRFCYCQWVSWDFCSVWKL